MKIDINDNIAEVMQLLSNSYYFGMFQNIGLVNNEQDEYRFRDALQDLESKISEAKTNTPNLFNLKDS